MRWPRIDLNINTNAVGGTMQQSNAIDDASTEREWQRIEAVLLTPTDDDGVDEPKPKEETTDENR
jgi:hypothetical protein